MNDEERAYEKVLVLQAQLGAEDAFEKLVGIYFARLSYYIRRILQNEENAKDVLQSVWLDVFRQLPQLRHAEAFRVWLYRIAHNKAVRASREYQRFIPIEETEAVPAVLEEDEDFSSHDAERIHKALNRLAPKFREVLVLRFLEEMPYQEIAGVVECNLGTVRSRIHYAKKALKKEIEVMENECKPRVKP